MRLGGDRYHCPVTERVSDRLLRLPFFNDLTEDDQSSVIETLESFGGWDRAGRPSSSLKAGTGLDKGL